MPEYRAYARVLVWARYFSDHGFRVIGRPSILEQSTDLHPANMQVLSVLQRYQLDDILCEENILINDYKPRAKGTPSEQKSYRTIGVAVSWKESELIHQRVKKANKSLSAYCRDLALNGKIVTLQNLDNLIESRKILRTLMEIGTAIYQTGKYYPSDLVAIRELIDQKINLDKRMVHEFSQDVNHLIQSAKDFEKRQDDPFNAPKSDM